MTLNKCELCYNNIYREEICKNCKELLKKMIKSKTLKDEYRPLINGSYYDSTR